VAVHAPIDKAFILADNNSTVHNMTDEHAKPDGGLTAEEQAVLDEIDERNVDFLRLQFTDILGVVKNVSVPAHQAEKAFDRGDLLRRLLDRGVRSHPGVGHASRP